MQPEIAPVLLKRDLGVCGSNGVMQGHEIQTSSVKPACLTDICYIDIDLSPFM